MTDYVVKPLDANTWDGFAGLARNGTTACSGAAGAPPSTRCTPRRRSTPTTTGVSSGASSRRAGRMPRNGTRTLFERAGFTFVRSKGTGNCVMRRTVP